MSNPSKDKGSRAEREIAGMLGGKRTPLSGATGGGDITLPTGSIWGDWSWEVKARRVLPALLRDWLVQAQADIRIGDRRHPITVVRADGYPPVAVCWLADLIGWGEALGETGRRSQFRSLAKELERIAGELRAVS